MKTFSEWLSESHPDPTRDYGDGHPDDRMNDLRRMVKEAEFQRMRTGRAHSVVISDGEYKVVPTHVLEMDPKYGGKVVYTAGGKG